jgi:hypothetical protein
MKTILRSATVMIVLVAIAGISACDNEPAPTAEETFMTKISGDWLATEITLDDVVIEQAFDGFKLSIKEDKKFSTTNGNDPIWASSGVFTLKSTNSAEIFDFTRDDGVEIKVKEATETSLILAFHYVSDGGRASSVTGDYVFKLVK